MERLPGRVVWGLHPYPALAHARWRLQIQVLWRAIWFICVEGPMIRAVGQLQSSRRIAEQVRRT